jgi:hypothetical protein
MTGHAKWGTEEFEFKIGPWADGIGLIMRHTGYSAPRETGAGIWPSIEKAQEIADQTVKRLLDPSCSIVWNTQSD